MVKRNSPDGCTGWHVLQHHFSAKLHSISGASDILFISSGRARSKVRTEQEPLLWKRSRWPIYDGLPLLDEKMLQAQADPCQLTEVLAGGPALASDTESACPFRRLCPLSSSITDLSRKGEAPLWPVLWHFPPMLPKWMDGFRPNCSPRWQAAFCFLTPSGSISHEEMFPRFVKELRRLEINM